MYYVYVELYKPLIPVKQHQIFTKWSFGSDLHNTYQRSALVSWPINRCPVSTQRCAMLFLDQKKEKIKNTGKCSKIKQNATSKESIKLCFSLILLGFFCNKSLKGQADMVSPQQPFSLFPLLNVLQKTVLEPSWNHCGERKAL